MWAQSYETGNVVKWETRTYSQSAHITRNHPVYWIRIGNATYQIASRSREVEMQEVQWVGCRVEKVHVFVRNMKGGGKEIRHSRSGIDLEVRSPTD